MAQNIVQGGLNRPVGNVRVVVTTPTTNVGNGIPASGTPVLWGRVPGVAEATVDDDGLTTVNHSCIANLSVTATNQSGNSAVAVGDLLYMDASSGVISKDSTKTPFGEAFASASEGSNLGSVTKTGTIVTAGQTATIQVWVGKVN